jgi:hypothetical protein
MGIWGYQTFENDAAMDWLSDLANADGVGFLERSLLPKDSDYEEAYLDSEAGMEILAAAEIVYGLLNGPRQGLPHEAIDWIEAQKGMDAAVLKPICERQLGRVLGGQSELHELWKENAEEYPKWKANAETLRNALTD